MSVERFADWPWRDWGEFGITRERAKREADRACVMANESRINGYGLPWRVNPVHHMATKPKKTRHWQKPKN